MTNSNYTEILTKHLYTLIKEELEDGEDDQTKKYAEYDGVLVPENVNKAIEALSNIKNYGPYAQNLRDPKTIEKVFGPNTPATKGRIAKETWNKFSEAEKRAKVLATEIVMRTNNTMTLEDQQNSKERIEKAIAQKTNEIKSEMPKYLWD
jgi:hypothetical protein